MKLSLKMSEKELKILSTFFLSNIPNIAMQIDNLPEANLTGELLAKALLIGFIGVIPLVLGACIIIGYRVIKPTLLKILDFVLDRIVDVILCFESIFKTQSK